VNKLNQPNVFNALFNPLQVQQFQRYLPTAFDEGLTLLEKVNKVIISLNQIGKLSNDVLDQWNQVMDWVMADGLDASINAKIDSMLQDGTLATIIGNAITDLGGQLTALTSTVSSNQTTLEGEIVTNKTTLEAEIATNTTAITNLSDKVTKMKFYGTPEEYGAVGDGVANDTSAVQQALTNCWITALNPASKYLVNTTLVLPKFHSISGNHAQFFASNSWVASSLGSNVPSNTILFVKGHDAYVNEDSDINTPFVRDLRIKGYGNLNTGMFLGTPDRNTIVGGSTNANGVIGYDFENISISGVSDGLYVGEAWQCTFKNIQCAGATNRALALVGQSVNNTFIGCIFRTANLGQYGVYIDHASYNGVNRRPEGIIFVGGLIGEGNTGVRVADGLSIKFTSVIVDLNSQYAVINDYTSEDITFTDCYLASTGTTCVSIPDNNDSSQYGRLSQFRGCNFIPAGASTTSAVIGQNQQAIFDGCQFTNSITFASTAMGSIINNIWNSSDKPAGTQIITNSGKTYVNNNTYKLTGNAVS
jgi:hypothetical protein